MRRLLPLLAALILLLAALPSPASASTCTPRVLVDGVEVQFDVPPVIENGRTLVPLRAIFEALGAEVFWDQETQTVSAVRGHVAMAIQIGNPLANVNDKGVPLDVPAKVVSGRTLVPLRFVSEAFGADVAWDGATCTVTITDGDPAPAVELTPLTGFWAQGISSYDMVDRVTGFPVKAGWDGQWYMFRNDGTFRYVIGGCGPIICGIIVQEGRYSATADTLTLSGILETFTPSPDDPGRRTGYKNKPMNDVVLTYTLTEEGNLKLTDDGGFSDVFHLAD